MCSSCAKKAAARGARVALGFKQKNVKRLQRLLREATRKGDMDKVNEINKRLNGDN